MSGIAGTAKRCYGSAMQLRALLALGIVLTACSRSPTDLREWTPSDHDHTVELGAPPSTPSAASSARSGHPDTGLPGVSELTLVTWRKSCMRCHGVLGRGDGPEGPLTHPPDLTSVAWQDSVSDAEIQAVISQGRGLMPSFTLPADTLEGLVRLLRLVRGAGAPSPSASSSGRAALPPPTAGSAPSPAPSAP